MTLMETCVEHKMYLSILYTIIVRILFFATDIWQFSLDIWGKLHGELHINLSIWSSDFSEISAKLHIIKSCETPLGVLELLHAERHDEVNTCTFEVSCDKHSKILSPEHYWNFHTFCCIYVGCREAQNTGAEPEGSRSREHFTFRNEPIIINTLMYFATFNRRKFSRDWL
jgi:hypothetical protein